MLKLSDPACDAAFRRSGYAVIPLLDAAAVAALREDWDKREDSVQAWPYAASLYSPDVEFRRATHAVIAGTIGPALAQAVPDAELVFAGFACKAANEPASIVPFHQDPSFVDETRWGAANIWIPLVDLDESNGPLWAVPGSHRFNADCRGFNQLFAYSGLEPDLAELARPIHARAGEAVVFAHSLFHFSPPNLSPAPRLAAGGLLAERGAILRYPYVDPEARDWIDLYDADPALFLEAPISTRPARTLVKRIPVQSQRANIEDIRRCHAELALQSD